MCVIALHAPRSSVTRGSSVVSDVCGAAADGCVVAMGDWNVRSEDMSRVWAPLIGRTSPKLAFPNERTCCWPEQQHYGLYDHVATSIGGAVEAGHKVHSYQITEECPVEEHKPVSASLWLPAR